MAFGVDQTGFITKRFEDIIQSLDENLVAELGQVNTTEDSVLGTIVNIFGKELSDLWEVMEVIYKSRDPDSAAGIALDDLADIVSISRIAATYSTAVLQLTGTDGLVIPVDFTASVTDTTDKFTINSASTIDKATSVEGIISVGNLLNSTLYTITVNGDPLSYTSDASATSQEIITGLISAITSGAQPVSATDNGDETLTIITDDYTISFSLVVDVNLSTGLVTSNSDFTAQVSGPITALATTLTTIETPVAGLDSVSNNVDAILGRNEELDQELRLRRQESLNIIGASTVEAIKARLLQIDAVTGAVVIENDTDIVDGDGRPPHSFECIVSGATDLAVAEEIWKVKPGGIQTYGNTSENITDSQGYIKAINFSRATEIYLWLKITLTYNTEETFPLDGTTQIRDASLAIAADFNIGDDVITQKFYSAVYSVPGVATALVEIATSATSGGPAGAYQTTNLVVGSTNNAVLDSLRTQVTIS